LNSFTASIVSANYLRLALQQPALVSAAPAERDGHFIFVLHLS